MDMDNVWVLWKATAVFMIPGAHTIYSRVTDTSGIMQPAEDPDLRNGINARPAVTVKVTGT